MHYFKKMHQSEIEKKKYINIQYQILFSFFFFQHSAIWRSLNAKSPSTDEYISGVPSPPLGKKVPVISSVRIHCSHI